MYDLDVSSITSSGLNALQVGQRNGCSIMRYWYVEGIANPKVAVNLILSNICNQISPSLLFVLQNLSMNVRRKNKGVSRVNQSTRGIP